MKNLRCLDVAIGSGWAMESMIAEGCKSCDGIDISQERILKTRESLEGKGRRNFRVWLDDAETLENCPSNHYDFVNYLDIIEHLVDYRSGIRQIKRVLKKGGLVYIKTTNNFTDNDLRLHHFSETICSLMFPETVPTPDGNRVMLRDDLKRLSEKEVEELTSSVPGGFHEHNHQFYPDELRDLVREEGFQIVAMTGTPLMSDILFNHENDIFGNTASAYVAFVGSEFYKSIVGALYEDLITGANEHRFRNLPPDYVLSDNIILVAKAK